MFDVRAFCGKPLPIRKGRSGKTPAYDLFVAEIQRGPRAIRALRRALLAVAMGLAILPARVHADAATTGAGPVALRISGSAFGETLEIEVRGLDRPRGEAALTHAWDAVVRGEREMHRLESRERVERDRLGPELWSLVARAREFCAWSDGALGPAGGAIESLWNAAVRDGGFPTPDQLEEAAATAKCARLTLFPETREFTLAAGSLFDFSRFGRGWAVDLAVDQLLASGASNLRVSLGAVTRAAGPGPAGQGWPVDLPALTPSAHSGSGEGRLLLRDQALAIADPGKSALLVAGETLYPVFDLRSGRPASGIASVFAVTSLAADAEPLAWSMIVLGVSGGQLRLGSLRPKPSVLWLLGAGDAAVVSSSNWSAVRKP